MQSTRPAVWTLLVALTIAWAGGSGCSSEIPVVAAPGRALSGTLQQAGGAPAFDPGEYSVAYLTRGGHFSSAFIGADGSFLLPIPTFAARGTIVLLDAVNLDTESVVAAVLVDDAGTPEALLALAPGGGDLVLADPLDVDTGAGTLLLTGAPPAALSFVAGPYTNADLCADDQAADCALSDAYGCGGGPCGTSVPLSYTVTACGPCLPDSFLFLGPFFPGVTAFTADDFDPEQDPLPDILAPFPGVAVTGLRIEIPPVDVGGVPQPAVFLDLGAIQPGLFYNDPADPATFHFAYEDGARFSADDIVALNLPEIPDGSLSRIAVRYRTTAGDFTTYRCACDNPDPLCTYATSCP